MICGKKRLDEYDPNNDLPPATGAQPFKKRRVASQAVDSYCEENGLKKDSKDDHRRGPFSSRCYYSEAYVDFLDLR